LFAHGRPSCTRKRSECRSKPCGSTINLASCPTPTPSGCLRRTSAKWCSISERFLYVVQGNSRALRYGIGVGRDGFQWSGLLKITRKSEWPDWNPPPEMIARQPYLPRFMAGGPGNPLGARALYLGNTVYRIHGTNQPQTIGQSISSGCFRLVNSDVIDLYDRIPVGTKVVVHQEPQM
jgi:lipoprotein-anchoring transpeptidase ErfK/SrfK